jgi:hypothetical protein
VEQDKDSLAAVERHFTTLNKCTVVEWEAYAATGDHAVVIVNDKVSSILSFINGKMALRTTETTTLLNEITTRLTLAQRALTRSPPTAVAAAAELLVKCNTNLDNAKESITTVVLWEIQLSTLLANTS